MDFGKDHIGGCGTPFAQEQSTLRFQIELFVAYGHLMAPFLEKVGLSLRQFTLLWAAGYRGTRTVANLASLAQVDPDIALEDLRVLEREGFVTLEAPPTQFATPRVERTDRYHAAYTDLRPILQRLAHPLRGDPARPWQAPPPRV